MRTVLCIHDDILIKIRFRTQKNIKESEFDEKL